MTTTPTTTTTSSTLHDALPGAEYTETHVRIIDAVPEQVWEELLDVRLSQLGVSRLLVAIRGLARPAAECPEAPLLEDGPVRLLVREPHRYLAGGRIARPWELNPAEGPALASMAELAAFAEPGWLKLGTDFVLHPLPDGRTLVRTTTLCEPTDDTARRRFTPYWWLIRPFSGLIRRDLLRVVASRSASTSPRTARSMG